MKTLLLGIAATTALLLTGCANEEDRGRDTNTSGIDEYHVKLENGQTVTCLVYVSGYAGGLSCDWEGAK